jgi:PEP-CTERM motif
MKMLNKIVGGSFGVAAALALSTSSVQAQNLLVNGSFETSPSGFTANPITLATVNQGWATFGLSQNNMSGSLDSPLDGSETLYGQQAAGSAYNNEGAYQIVSGITVGTTYNLLAYTLTDIPISSPFTSNSGVPGPVDIQLQFMDASLNTLATFDHGWSPTGPMNTWTQYSVSGAAPVGTAYAAVYLFYMYDGAQTTTQEMYYDKASLVATPEPATFSLVGMGLASSFFLIRRRKS